MRRIKYIENYLLKNSEFVKKIYIYMSTKTAGDDYDPYENNFTYTNLNPKIVKGYVSQLSPQSLVWKSYVLKEQGAIEVVCDKKDSASLSGIKIIK